MLKTLRLTLTLALLGSATLYAQDISGAWQGTLKIGSQTLRSILRIERANDATWKAAFLSIDQGGFDTPIAASSVTLRDSVLQIVFASVGGTYNGRLTADGNVIKGTWTQNNGPLPLNYVRPTKETEWRDPSPHTSRFVTVDKDVKLEVLDWGGSGRPLVFLAGLGNSGHIFDTFAPNFTNTCHVYAITRRGFGFSSHPESGYSADRLGDDVLAVLDSLGINRPVIAGHSIAGEELSSIGSRHPEKVAGLIYLDAGYPYAFYDRTRGDFGIDLSNLRKKLDLLDPASGTSPEELRRLIREVRDTLLPAFDRDLRDVERRLPPASSTASAPLGPRPQMPLAPRAIIAGEQKYTNIPVPVLAIYAYPHSPPSAIARDSAARLAFLAQDSSTGRQAAAFEKGVPTAKVVRLPNADHYVFNSNEADVLREMRAFIDALPRGR